jgi:hypothetical protein
MVTGPDLFKRLRASAPALANSRLVPQGLYDRAVKSLGHGITDMITLMGYYTSRLDDPGVFRRPAGTPGMAR